MLQLIFAKEICLLYYNAWDLQSDTVYVHAKYALLVVNDMFAPNPSRILEMKNEMVNLELLEFHYFDDILTDMKLTPVRLLVMMYIHCMYRQHIRNVQFT